MVQHTFYLHHGCLIFSLTVFQCCIDSGHSSCWITNCFFFLHNMNVVDCLLSIGTDQCIVRSLEFPTFYRFLTFIILNRITVIICKFFISCDSRVCCGLLFELLPWNFLLGILCELLCPKFRLGVKFFFPGSKLLDLFVFQFGMLSIFRFFS